MLRVTAGTSAGAKDIVISGAEIIATNEITVDKSSTTVILTPLDINSDTNIITDQNVLETCVVDGGGNQLMYIYLFRSFAFSGRRDWGLLFRNIYINGDEDKLNQQQQQHGTQHSSAPNNSLL